MAENWMGRLLRWAQRNVWVRDLGSRLEARGAQRAAEYGVDAGHHRVGPGLPATSRDDLCVILDICERETDDALGILQEQCLRKRLQLFTSCSRNWIAMQSGQNSLGESLRVTWRS